MQPHIENMTKKRHLVKLLDTHIGIICWTESKEHRQRQMLHCWLCLFLVRWLEPTLNNHFSYSHEDQSVKSDTVHVQAKPLCCLVSPAQCISHHNSCVFKRLVSTYKPVIDEDILFSYSYDTISGCLPQEPIASSSRIPTFFSQWGWLFWEIICTGSTGSSRW